MPDFSELIICYDSLVVIKVISTLFIPNIILSFNTYGDIDLSVHIVLTW
mgnify:CR=1 FL=1